MWRKLKQLACRLASDTAGRPSDSPASPSEPAHACYRSCDRVSRWQGDVYSAANFAAGSLPTSKAAIPYWMLVNRTCHLVEEGGRTVRLPYLTYCAVVSLSSFIGDQEKTVKNAIGTLLGQKDDHGCFLPTATDFGVVGPLVADFSLVWTVRLEATPRAKDKVLQLSSPFSEHVFQRFSRWFYTVGYDDASYRDTRYVENLVRLVEIEIAAAKALRGGGH
jgi:hypothetical protein